MTVYFVSENTEGFAEELRRAVKETIQKKFPQANEDPVFSLAYDQAHQLFLKGAMSIYWGRIFTHKISLSDVYKLEQEIEHLAQTFSQGVHPCIFFPHAESAVVESLRQLRPSPMMYEYYALESESGKNLAIRPVHQEFYEKSEMEPYSYYRQSRLTRDELAELIDLSCSLKKIETVSVPR